MTRPSTDSQRLWCCHWGTMTALVWARSADWAVARVRHSAFDRTLTPEQVRRRPRAIRGLVTVREATEADRERYQEAGGVVPA